MDSDSSASRIGSEEDDIEEEVLEPKVLPKRRTRGLRMGKLIGEAADADKDFWEQEAWRELSEDEDIHSDEYAGSDAKDLEDSDFDDADENADVERERAEAAALDKSERRRRRPQKKSVYVDPAALTKKKKRPQKRQAAATEPVAQQRAFRRSTAAKGATAAHARTAAAAAAMAKAAKRPRPKNVEVVRMTQQELLEEAARTEVKNRLSLKAMLQLQEERRSATEARNVAMSHERVQFRSTLQGNTLTFIGVDAVPSAIQQKAPQYPAKSVCAVTGLPAKYRDPVTGLPYSSREALAAIRSNYKRHVAAAPARNRSRLKISVTAAQKAATG